MKPTQAKRILRHGLSMSRRHPVAAMLAALTFSGAALSGALWACADSSCSPDWRLALQDYDCGGHATISPGNDTRINLLLLMQSLRPAEAQPARAVTDVDNPQFGQTFLSWPGMRAAFWPTPAPVSNESADPAPGCAASSNALPAFAAALAAEPGLPAGDREALTRLRAKTGCNDAAWEDAVVSSKAGREYLAYLKAADAFHRNDWSAAREGFAALTRARSQWVAETAKYMPIRIGLRAAVASAVTDYGDFAGPDKADRAAIAEARDGIAAYLKAYSKGRYAASARGLTRRVAWLSGDMAALTKSYEALLAATPGGDEAAADLAEEIDIKLLERQDAGAIIGGQQNVPLLLAVSDLKRMRGRGDDATALSAADLAAQKGQFSAHGDLYGLLQASRSYYAGEDPRAILTLVPDAARANRFTPITFSRQMLRGMALAKSRDPNEVGFWRDLLNGASPRYERPLVEMGLAIRWQRDGQVAQIFAPGSPVTDTSIRSILLQSLATPTILRGSAQDASRPTRERDIARFTLLYKGLSKGAYADFAKDLALVPATADSAAGLWDFTQQDIIPTGLFRTGKWSDGFACPAVVQTAATLARTPNDARARLCLGDFYRLNGFDGFSLFNADKDAMALGNGQDGFSGRSLSRSDIYTAIIADKGAAPDNRAYALYRAVMCYAPSGFSNCGGPYRDYEEMDAAQAPKSDRKAWFTELKQRYPNSQWAKALRYYW